MTEAVGGIAVAPLARDRIGVRVDEICLDCGAVHVSAGVTINRAAPVAVILALRDAIDLADAIPDGVYIAAGGVA